MALALRYFRLSSIAGWAMKHKCLMLVCLLVALPVRAAAEEDELCTRLRAFQEASFDKDREGKPIRRAIEFHWIGGWMDFEGGFGNRCLYFGTAPGMALCAWLPENTSTEFPSILPMRVLGCYGWKIPAYANDFDVRTGSFRITTDAQGHNLKEADRYLQLEIDMRFRKKAHTAIRLSVIPRDEKFLDPEPSLEIDEPVSTENDGRLP
jgi:hypothetical protein